MNTRMAFLIGAALSGTVVAGSAYGHHSNAAHYDSSRTVEIDGVVADFQFVNPHSVVLVDVEKEDGSVERWQVESTAANNLRRQGWDENTLSRGDVIRVFGSPHRKNIPQMVGREFQRTDGAPVIAVALAYSGPVEAADEHVRPLRTLGTPIADHVQRMPYTQLQHIIDEQFPSGQRYYWKSNFVREITEELVDTISEHFASVPSPRTAVIFQQMGAAVARVSADATAFRHRDAQYNLFIASAWTDPADDEKNIAWSREIWQAVRPFSMVGVYVNELGEEGAERVREAYGENYAQIATLKAKYDPSNFFGVNQNIAPVE